MKAANLDIKQLRAHLPGMRLWERKQGGHLATITYNEEWHALKSILGEVHDYYLGGTDEKTEGVWDGSPMKYQTLPSGPKVSLMILELKIR